MNCVSIMSFLLLYQFNIYHMFRSSSHFLNHLLVSYRCTPNLSSNPIMGLQVFHPLHYTDHAENAERKLQGHMICH